MKFLSIESLIREHLKRQPWTHDQCTRWIFFWALLPSPFAIYWLSDDFDLQLPGVWIIFGLSAILCYFSIWYYLRQFFHR